MHLNHYIRRPLVVEILDTGVEELPDGEFAAWAEYLIGEEAWEDWQSELTAAGVPGAMSFTFSVPISPSVQPVGAQAQVAGDAAHYSNDELTEAAATLGRALSNPTEADQLFQFNAVSVAMVVIEFTTDLLASVGPNVLASALWDACRLLWHPGVAPNERSRFTVTARESRHGRRRLKLVIDVPDERARDCSSACPCGAAVSRARHLRLQAVCRGLRVRGRLYDKVDRIAPAVGGGAVDAEGSRLAVTAHGGEAEGG